MIAIQAVHGDRKVSVQAVEFLVAEETQGLQNRKLLMISGLVPVHERDLVREPVPIIEGELPNP